MSQRYFQNCNSITIVLLFVIVMLSVTYYSPSTLAQTTGNANNTTVTPSGAAAQQLQNLPVPLFARCDVMPSVYKTGLAIYTIEGATTSGKLSNTVGGKQGVAMVITDNNTGRLSGRLVTDNNNNQPVELNIAGKNNSVYLDIQHVTTQCTQKLSIQYSNASSSLGRNPIQAFSATDADVNPPVQVCTSPSNQTIYIINTTANQTQPLNNLTAKHHVTMIMTIASEAPETNLQDKTKPKILTHEISGKLILDNNDPVNLNIREIDTLCAVNPIGRSTH
jgi:hypothetical protein